MSQILLEFDNLLKHSDIIIPLTNTSAKEVGDDNYFSNYPNRLQTSVYGILAPLIEINNIVIDFDDVVNFSLRSIKTLPSIELTAIDKYGLIKSLDTPKNDNELRIEILPPFENAYKKINLTFYISSINVKGNMVTVSGIFKDPELTSTKFICLGEKNTYDLFKQIATETKLGFATNIQANNLDKRYVYCNDKSYLDVLEREIKTSGSEEQILDFWIDFWNNINLADIKERYTTIDPEKDLLIWITGESEETEEGIERKPILTGALLTNHPYANKSELHVESYDIINKGTNLVYNGTDKVYSMYENDKNEYLDYLILDGDIKKDIFLKHEYLGEVYGDFNYFKMKKCRDAFIQKINSENLKVILKSPLLALMRGHKVNFSWYINDDIYNMKKLGLSDAGFINNDAEPNVPMLDDKNISINSDAGTWVLDKNISGLYLITGCEMNFKNSEWEYILTLNKTAENRLNVLLVPEEKN